MEKLIVIKEKIKKINSFIEAIDDKGFSSIERDILLSKLRDLYYEVLEQSSSQNSNLSTNTQIKEQKPENKNTIEPIAKTVEEPKYETVKHETIVEFLDSPEPVSEIVQMVQPEPQKPVEIANTVKKPSIEQKSLFNNNGNQVKTIGEQLGQNKTSLNDMLAGQKSTNDVSSRIGLKPISDIKAAIGIGDRFLYIRELFAGNNDTFEETIVYLNSLQSFEDAYNHLSSTFKWDETQQTVSSFLNVVKRRYL